MPTMMLEFSEMIELANKVAKLLESGRNATPERQKEIKTEADELIRKMNVISLRYEN